MTAKTKTLRIFTAALATETNTFSPICIDRRAFEASLYASPGKHPETPTLCTAPITVGRRVAAEKGWILIEGTAAWADPAGLVNRRTYEDLRDEILDQLRAALPIDAVILGLHGAMVADGYEDTEGDLLQRVRELVGPEVLVCAELDPHSHLTNRRVAVADFFVFFKEFPHTDFVERAEDLWRVAVDTLEGRVTPVMSVFDCRMIDVFPTSREPMRSFVDRLMQIERHDADVLSLSVVHGFMAGDVTEMGTKMLVVTNGKAEKGKALARELGLELFSRRGTYRMPEIGAHQAVAQAIAAPSGPVVIADMWDNPGGGNRRRCDGRAGGIACEKRDRHCGRHDLGSHGGADLHGGGRRRRNPLALRREIRARHGATDRRHRQGRQARAQRGNALRREYRPLRRRRPYTAPRHRHHPEHDPRTKLRPESFLRYGHRSWLEEDPRDKIHEPFLRVFLEDRL